VEEKTQARIILLSNMDEEKLFEFEKNGRSSGLTMGGILRKPMDMTSIQTKLKDLITPDPGKASKKKVIRGQLTILQRLMGLNTCNLHIKWNF